LPLIIDWNHAQGHQESNATTVLLHDAWLNIVADALAKQKLDPHWIGPKTFCIPSKWWSFAINKVWITKQMSEVIQTHINGIPAIKHWKRIFQLF